MPLMPPLKVRFLFGSLILLLVDVLWVASSEITEYLYHGLHFDKPFFTAYVKSIMFSIYLAGFIFCDSWWWSYRSLPTQSLADDLLAKSEADDDEEERNLTLDQDDDDDEVEDEDTAEEDVDSSNEELAGVMLAKKLENQQNIAINCSPEDVEPMADNSRRTSQLKRMSLSARSAYIGESIWMPMKRCSDTSSLSGKSSETEDDETFSYDGSVTIEKIPIAMPSSPSSSKSAFFSLNGRRSPSGKSRLFSTSVNFKKKKIRRARHNKRAIDEAAAAANSSSADGGSSPALPSPNGSLKEKKRARAVRFSKLIEVRQLTEKHAEEHFLSRLSYSAFMRLIYNRNQAARGVYCNHNSNGAPQGSPFAGMIYTGGQLGVKDTAMLAFYFTAIWFTANMSFHMGLRYSEAGLVNVLSSTTPLFTLLLGIIFPSGSSTDAISLTKLLGVLLCISSVALLSTTEPISPVDSSLMKSTQPTMAHHFMNANFVPLGSLWSLGGAFFYAVYIVLMRYNVPHDSMLNFPMFFGFIGLFSAVLMWPILLLLHFTQLETFVWPTRPQWVLLLVNGACGTVVSELLWLLGSFMTSSLVGTIAVSFTIPLAVCFDVFYKNIIYPRLFFLGTIPMFISFVVIIVVSQYDRWDPILALFERCVLCFKSGLVSRNPRVCGGGTGAGNRDQNENSGSVNATNLLMEQDDSLEEEGAIEIVNKTEGSGGDSPLMTLATNNRRYESGSRPSSATTPSLSNTSFKKLMTDSAATAVPVLSASTAKLYNFGVDNDDDDDSELSQALIDITDDSAAYA